LRKLLLGRSTGGCTVDVQRLDLVEPALELLQGLVAFLQLGQGVVVGLNFLV
jgi:hypothetical protein